MVEPLSSPMGSTGGATLTRLMLPQNTGYGTTPSNANIDGPDKEAIHSTTPISRPSPPHSIQRTPSSSERFNADETSTIKSNSSTNQGPLELFNRRPGEEPRRGRGDSPSCRIQGGSPIDRKDAFVVEALPLAVDTTVNPIC